MSNDISSSSFETIFVGASSGVAYRMTYNAKKATMFVSLARFGNDLMFYNHEYSGIGRKESIDVQES